MYAITIYVRLFVRMYVRHKMYATIAQNIQTDLVGNNMASRSFIRSELLCFVQNNISNRVSEHIVTSVCGFFTLEDVTKAKDLYLK